VNSSDSSPPPRSLPPWWQDLPHSLGSLATQLSDLLSSFSNSQKERQIDTKLMLSSARLMAECASQLEISTKQLQSNPGRPSQRPSHQVGQISVSREEFEELKRRVDRLETQKRR
jgi:hypothetical protein